MIIRNAKTEEIDNILELYEAGRQYMAANGNTFQWVNGYPSRELITEDIKLGQLYVVEDNNCLECVFAMIPGEDETYKKIYGGSWLNNEPYCAIHRISVVSHGKGIASFVYKWAITKCDNIRIDTHRKNIPMQNSLKKSGFKYCGIIYLISGDERIAFQLTKNNSIN